MLLASGFLPRKISLMMLGSAWGAGGPLRCRRRRLAAEIGDRQTTHGNACHAQTQQRRDRSHCERKTDGCLTHSTTSFAAAAAAAASSGQVRSLDRNQALIPQLLLLLAAALSTNLLLLLLSGAGGCCFSCCRCGFHTAERETGGLSVDKYPGNCLSRAEASKQRQQKQQQRQQQQHQQQRRGRRDRNFAAAAAAAAAARGPGAVLALACVLGCPRSATAAAAEGTAAKIHQLSPKSNSQAEFSSLLQQQDSRPLFNAQPPMPFRSKPSAAAGTALAATAAARAAARLQQLQQELQLLQQLQQEKAFSLSWALLTYGYCEGAASAVAPPNQRGRHRTRDIINSQICSSSSSSSSSSR
ncbi:hypothetical protein Emag_006459 [Eimeria magna]